MRARVSIKKDRVLVRASFAWKDEMNSREIDYLSRNAVLGLMGMKQRRKKVLDYSMGAGISLNNFLKSPITKRDFLLIMAQIDAIFHKTRQVKLLPKNVCLDVKYVFINPVTKELSFLYLPVISSFVGADYLGFMSYIISMVKPVPEQNGDFISQYAFFLRNLDVYDPVKIDAFIASVDRTVMEMVSRNSPAISKELQEKPTEASIDFEEDTSILESIDWDYEEDTGLLSGGQESGFSLDTDDEGTTNLSDSFPAAGATPVNARSERPQVKLIRILNGQEILVDKPVFRIGKERSYVDCFIADNGAISRSHADIISRNGRVFICDKNSKNGTYVNGSAITPETEVELFVGDSIRLANEEFRFCQA